MESNSMVKNIVFVLVLAAVLFLGYRWWMSRNAAPMNESSSTTTTETVTTPAPEATPVAEQPVEQAAAEVVEAPAQVQA